MNRKRLISIVAVSATCGLLGACATTAPAPQDSASARNQSQDKSRQQLNFKLSSGTYRCDLGQQVEIQRDPRNANALKLAWQGSHYTLQRYESDSGLPRYEDRAKGLLWIDLPWKSVLMDANSGRPLANDCKAAKG